MRKGKGILFLCLALPWMAGCGQYPTEDLSLDELRISVQEPVGVADRPSETETGKGEPVVPEAMDLERLLAGYAESGMANYRSTGEIRMDMEADTGWFPMEVPLAIRTSLERQDGISHGEIQVDAMDGMTGRTELYGDEGSSTIRERYGDGDWTRKSGSIGGVLGLSDLSGFPAEGFSGASFAETEQGYQVTQPFSAFQDTAGGDVLSDLFVLCEGLLGEDIPESAWSDVRSQLLQGTLEFCFGKDTCRLESVVLADVPFSSTMELSEMTCDLSGTLSLSVSFFDYGQVSGLVVPE